MREPRDLYETPLDTNARDVELPAFPVSRFASPIQFASYAPDVTTFSDPTPSRGGFPERIAFDASGIMAALESVRTAPDALFGVTRFIPGVSGLGDFLGGVGDKLGESPLGKTLGAFGGGVGTLAAETLGAVVGRVGDVAQELGTIASQKEARFDDPLRLLGTVFGGKTGARAFDFSRPIDDKVWEDMPQDIMDTVNLVGLIPALKVAGMIGRGSAPRAFLSGATNIRNLPPNATAAAQAGQATGRGITAAYGAGLAVEAAVPRFGDNEVTRSIMENRIVNDDSPWRFPFDIAASLPLDVFALTRAAAGAKQSAWMSQKIFGAIDPAEIVVFPNLHKGVDKGLITYDDASWGVGLAERVAAAKKKIASHNANAPEGAQIETYHQLDEKVFGNINNDVDAWRASNPRELRDAAVTEMLGWEEMFGVDEANKMYWMHEFVKIARPLADANPNVILGVADAMQAVQAPLAIRALDDISDWNKYEQGLFRKEFPAFSDDLDGFLAPNQKQGLKALILDTVEKGAATAPPTMGATDVLTRLRSLTGEEFDELARRGTVGPYADWTGADKVNAVRSGSKPSAVVTDAEIDQIKAAGLVYEKRLFDTTPYGEKLYTVYVARDGGALARLVKNVKKEGIESAAAAGEALGYSAEDIAAYLKQNFGYKALGAIPKGRPLEIPAPAELGALLMHQGRLATRLLAGEAVGPEWRKTLDDIKAIRDEVAAGYAKQREHLADVLAQAEDAVRVAAPAEKEALQIAAAIARDKLKVATIDYYNAFTAGSRWTVKSPPSGNVMRLTDVLPTRPDTKGRNKMGEIYDALFGHVKNSELGRKSLQQVMDAGAASGVSPEIMGEFQDELRKIIKRFTKELGSAEFRLFASVWHLPAFVINNAAKELKLPMPVGYKNWSEVFYRAYPGPFKILSEAVGLKLPDVPYNAVTQVMFHTVGRSLYGTFRFTMDPRFILLNFSEADILKAAGAKRGTPDGESAERLYRLIQKLDKETGDTGALEMGERRGRLAAQWGASRRPDELWDSVVRVLKDHPANEDVLRKYGVKTPDDLAKFLDKALAERIAAFDGVTASTADETALAARIKALETDPDAIRGPKEGTVEEMKDDLAEKIRRRQWAEAQLSEKWRPELQPFFDAMVENDIKLSKAASQVFRGNPDRPAIERAMNSYLLYWPLSYQLSRGKLLAEFMFSKALGYRTGSAGAQSWLEFRQMHEQKLQTDPEYAQFFIDNKDLLFVMQQMIPLTPEDVGVSLSPITRAPIRLQRGETPIKVFETLNNIGPLYTNDLLKRIVAEQSKPGGMWGRFIDGDTE